MSRKFLIGAILVVIATAPGAWAREVGLLQYGQIQDGMTEAEVLARLGPPDHESFEGYTPGNALIKSFYYYPSPGSHQDIITVIRFVAGRVVNKQRIYVQKPFEGQ